MLKTNKYMIQYLLTKYIQNIIKLDLKPSESSFFKAIFP